jgi:hypothetical protein
MSATWIVISFVPGATSPQFGLSGTKTGPLLACDAVGLGVAAAGELGGPVGAVGVVRVGRYGPPAGSAGFLEVFVALSVWPVGRSLVTDSALGNNQFWEGAPNPMFAGL